MKVKIGYLGPQGTFSYQAAKKYGEKINNAQLIPFISIGDCLLATNKGEVDFGVVPIENSIEGTVTFTIDSLIFDVDVIIEKDLVMPIRHCMALKRGTNPKDVTKIFSHPQALAQCKKHLGALYHDVEKCPVASTTEGATMVLSSEEPFAAICNEESAIDLGLEIIYKDLQDEKHNETRFLVVTQRENKEFVYEGKTTIVFGTDNKPGALYKILDIIAIWDLNMTKIESRPRKDELGKYVFYIDMESTNAADVKDALKMIERKTRFFKHLGTYHTF